MTTPRDAKAAGRSDSQLSYRGLAMSAGLCAAAAIYALFLNAQDPKLATTEAERTAALALNRIGYQWAKVRIEDGVAHISGIAPGEPERVLAYEVVYKALRPVMTQSAAVTRVASHIALPERTKVQVAQKELPPSDADFRAVPVASAPSPKVTIAAATEPQRPAPPSGTTWSAAMLPQTTMVPSEATVYVALNAPAPASKTPTAPTAITTAAIDKPAEKASVSANECKAALASVVRRSGIAFASTSSRISKESAGTLDRLAAAAKQCGSFAITVEGHTDGYGAKGYNMALSRQRAMAVRQALIDRGVRASQVNARGFGSSKPLTRGAATARNRRIEFTVSDATGSPAHAKAN